MGEHIPVQKFLLRDQYIFIGFSIGRDIDMLRPLGIQGHKLQGHPGRMG